MAKIKLTKSAVDAAQPQVKVIELRDTVVPGFLCKITPAGRKVFMLQYRTNAGERRKPALGQWRPRWNCGPHRGHWGCRCTARHRARVRRGNLATPDAVLVIDETGFFKQGKASCGVARQYTGSAGKITNCQIGVFAIYVSTRGHAFIDRVLYSLKSWTADPAKLAATHVPEEIVFATKPTLAADMIQRALASDVPFSWVAADAVYGVGEIEGSLRRACKGYVPGVKSDHRFGSWLGKPLIAGTAQPAGKHSRIRPAMLFTPVNP